MKSRFTNITCIVILVITTFSQSVHAQNNTRETGLRLGPNGSDFIFKKEKGENRFSRKRLGLNNLGIFGSDNFVASLNFAIGLEKRKSIDEKLWLIKGWEPGIGFASVSDRSSIRPGLGYILGFQYDVSDIFYVNMEVRPSISVDLGDGASESLIIDAGLNSSAAISVVYRFQKK